MAEDFPDSGGERPGAQLFPLDWPLLVISVEYPPYASVSPRPRVTSAQEPCRLAGQGKGAERNKE